MDRREPKLRSKDQNCDVASSAVPKESFPSDLCSGNTGNAPSKKRRKNDEHVDKTMKTSQNITKTVRNQGWPLKSKLWAKAGDALC